MNPISEEKEGNHPAENPDDITTGKKTLVYLTFIVVAIIMIITVIQLFQVNLISAFLSWIVGVVLFYLLVKSGWADGTALTSNFDDFVSGDHMERQLDDHINEDSGNYVTSERVSKIIDVLEEDEQVLYLLRGTQIDVEGSGSGTSFWGNDRSRKQGTSGWVRTAITNKRVITKIPQIFGNDERSVPYQSIVSVDLDTSIGVKRITLQTAGSTYHIEAGHPSRDECREATRYIRQKISEANQPQVVQESAEANPIEQIEQLKNLHESGALTDEEYEDKKQTLLDKI